MLREAPGYSPHIMHNIDPDHFEPTTDALDDIFGSEPNSPVPAPVDSFSTDPTDDPDYDALDATLAAPLASAGPAHSGERSDIPRLRSTHVTSGYRDGIAESKAQYVQEGFDEGYSLGAVLGLKAGWLVGVFEGVVRAINSDVGASDEVKGSVREEFVKVREELSLTSLFGRKWFGADGVWIFEVRGEDEEVTFREVADSHPLILKWTGRVKEVQERFGLDLAGRVRDEEVDDAEQGSS